MEKMNYESLDLEIIKFEAEDIITESGGNKSPEDDP